MATKTKEIETPETIARNKASARRTALSKLVLLRDLRTQTQETNDEKQKRIDDLLPKSTREKISHIEEDFKERLEHLAEREKSLKEEISSQVIVVGETVSSDEAMLQAVYAKGRTSWNNDSLTGYAVAHPEILDFRSVGDPSVSIREKK